MAYLLKHAILLILVSPSLGMLQRINASAVVVFQEPALNKERAILTNLSYSSIGIRLHYLSSNGEVSDVLRFISLYHKEYPSLLPMIVLVNSFQERMLYEVAKYRRLENVVYSPNNCYEVQ